MREVISPALHRALGARVEIPVVEMQAQIERRRAEQEAQDRARVEQAAVLLERALEPLGEQERRTIRREVALRLPDRPMTKADMQVWLDEHAAGVAIYCVTGKLP